MMQYTMLSDVCQRNKLMASVSQQMLISITAMYINKMLMVTNKFLMVSVQTNKFLKTSVSILYKKNQKKISKN